MKKSDRNQACAPPMASDKILRTSRAAALVVRDTMMKDHPRLWNEVSQASRQGIVVVPASLDIPGLAVRDLELPHFVVPAQLLDEASLAGVSIVIVGCPGFTGPGIDVLDAFVRAGGTLLTTGAAAETVIDALLPGRLAFSESPPTSTLVRVQAATSELVHLGIEGQWDLSSEPRSLLIRGTAPDGVQILLAGSANGSDSFHDPLALRMTLGQGQIIHLETHVVAMQPPGVEGIPAVLDPRWNRLLSDVGAPLDLVAGLTSQALDRAARAITFLTWVMAESSRTKKTMSTTARRPLTNGVPVRPANGRSPAPQGPVYGEP